MPRDTLKTVSVTGEESSYDIYLNAAIRSVGERGALILFHDLSIFTGLLVPCPVNVLTERLFVYSDKEERRQNELRRL